MTKAEEIFNTKAEYNKWLKELTDNEKELILEMINEALHQSNAVEQSKQLTLFKCPNCGNDWDIEKVNSCECGASVRR